MTGRDLMMWRDRNGMTRYYVSRTSGVPMQALANAEMTYHEPSAELIEAYQSALENLRSNSMPDKCLFDMKWSAPKLNDTFLF